MPPPSYGPPQGYSTGYAGPVYAGFWIRFVAVILDAFILLGIIILLVITIIGILAIIPVAIGYRPYLWWKNGGTYGQRALGIRIVMAVDGSPIDGGTAVVRAVVWWACSAIPFGFLGFIWPAFEPRKRAWHDLAAGTVAIRVD
jgi:uncharacterized RDD family membrane protein YckC